MHTTALHPEFTLFQRRSAQLQSVTALTCHVTHQRTHSSSHTVYNRSPWTRDQKQTETSRYHWRPADAADATTTVHPNNVQNVQYCYYSSRYRVTRILSS